MRNKIQQAFDPVVAGPMLKSETKNYLSGRLYHSTKVFFPIRHMATVLACLVVLVFGGYYTCLIPVSTISIDVNPSFELRINRLGRVVAAEGYNEDGDALVLQLSVRHLPYEQAIETVLKEAQIQRYLAEGEQLSMTVVGNSEKQSQQMLTALSRYTTQENISCHAANVQETENAHGHGLSIGKYSACLALCELDSSATIEEVKHLTMRQIRDRIRALSGGESLPQGSQSRNGVHHGEHTGNGCCK